MVAICAASLLLYLVDGFELFEHGLQAQWSAKLLTGLCGAGAGLYLYKRLLSQKTQSHVSVCELLKMSVWEWLFVLGSAMVSGLLIGVLLAVYKVSTQGQ